LASEAFVNVSFTGAPAASFFVVPFAAFAGAALVAVFSAFGAAFVAVFAIVVIDSLFNWEVFAAIVQQTQGFYDAPGSLC
jgi:hypothetical protein